MAAKSNQTEQETAMMKLVTIDEIHEAAKVESREEHAGCASRLTLTFLTPLLKKGSEITLRDMGRPLTSDRAAEVSTRFRKAWNPMAAKAMASDDKKVKVPDLFGAQLRSLDGGYAKFGGALFCYLVEGVLQLVPAIILGILVKHFEDGGHRLSMRAQWFCVAALYLAPTLGSLCRSRYDTCMVHFGSQMYSAVSLALYEKALRLSPTARAEYDTGKIVTLFSVDAFSVQRLLLFIGILFSGPVIIVLCLLLLNNLLGWECTLLGLGFMIAIVPLQFLVFIPYLKYQKLYLKHADMRVKVMNEVLGGVRVVKYLAWERPFFKKVMKLRDNESHVLWRQGFIIGLGFAVIMLGAPIFQPVLIFWYYTRKLGRSLDASTAFSTLALFALLRLPLAFLPFCLITYLTYRVSARRMAKFLVAPELQENNTKPEKHACAIEKSSFAWAIEKDETPIDEENPVEKKPSTLRNISLTIPRGALVGVVGPVGSGKSSLLAALAGEMETITGKASVDKSQGIAYCSQVPWVLNATLRDNVTFGEAFDANRFSDVVAQCALKDDLGQLPGGADCEIGERGINLSGGQKARVALARAAYSPNGLVLLDDPLSAVDAHVAQHLVDRCIAGPAFAGRTRVLVTHHASVLPRCDVIIVMRDGEVAATGSYDELTSQQVDMGELTSEDEKKSTPVQAVSIDEAFVVESTGVSVEAVVVQEAVPEEDKTTEGKLTSAEGAQKGLVSNRTWFVFARAGGWGWIAVAVIALLGGRASELAGSFYLAKWTTRHDDPGRHDVMKFVYNYLGYALGAVAGLAIRGVVLAHHRIRAADKLHATILERVLFAPTAFFDVTPIGRVLNRFSGDILCVDTELSRTMSEFSGVASYVLGAIVALCVATKGLYLVLAVPLLLVYRQIDLRFRFSSTQISRLAKLARSPVVSDFTEILNGVSTVRAYGAVARFEERLRDRPDGLNTCVVNEQLAYNWLAVRLDQLAAISSASVAALAVATKGSLLSPGLLGLALAACIEITGFLKNAVRLSTLLASNMASIERLGEYGDCFRDKDSTAPPLVPREAAEVVPLTDDKWAPSKGAIVVADAKMRYRDGPLVLKGVSLRIQGGHRVGVVGRTGSGKSSMAAALFRIVELDSGSISIDGVDTRTLGLRELRRGLFIIPQDPVLFSASLRFNVDPFDEYSDEEVLGALKKAELSALLSSYDKGLDEVLQEGGSNLSVGQRQLVCIARALLRKPKILVLDEATASIDNETDAAIQRQIREGFVGSTTITIAHRLHTILDSDRVLVLDDGRVLEYDAPARLLADPSSRFRALVDAAKGRSPSQQNLLQLAEDEARARM